MTGLLFTGGEGPSQKTIQPILDSSPRIVAADSGLELARMMNVVPEAIVGDMDSLSDKKILDEYPENIVFPFPEDKDETDTELGIRMLHDYGCDRLIIAGGGGGRLDHIVGILSLFDREICPHIWYTRYEQIMLITDRLQIACSLNERLSLFPVGSVTARMKSTGLVWPLDHLVWRRGDAGISNRAASPVVTVTMISGRLILIRECNEEGRQ